jgi:hypothetical protein
VASGSCDQHVYVWQVDRPREPPVALKGHTGVVTAVDWCPHDFGCLASCADYDTARVWCIKRVTADCDADRRGGTRGVMSPTAAAEAAAAATDDGVGGFGGGIGGSGSGGGSGAFGSPAVKREAPRDEVKREPHTSGGGRTGRSTFAGGEWLARAIEEGFQLDFEMATPAWMGAVRGALTPAAAAARAGAGAAAAKSPTLVTPALSGAVARSRGGGGGGGGGGCGSSAKRAKPEPQSNTINMYFTPVPSPVEDNEDEDGDEDEDDEDEDEDKDDYVENEDIPYYLN